MILPDGGETRVKMTPCFCLSNLMNVELRNGERDIAVENPREGG